MVFKKYWSLKLQIRFGFLFCELLMLIAIIYFSRSADTALLLFLLSAEAILLLAMFIVMYKMKNFFSIKVYISEDGVSLLQGQQLLENTKWDELKEIQKSQHFGTDTIVLKRSEGGDIWFYTSPKIEKYILAHCSNRAALSRLRKGRA